MAENQNEFIPTRKSLLVRVKNLDDQESWNDFFNTYWKLIFSVAAKAGLREQEAQDVVQETLLAVTKAIQDYRYEPERCSFKSWLRLLIRRRIADHFRKRSRNVATSESNSEPGASTQEVERIADPAGPEQDALWEDEWQKHLVEVALEKFKRQTSAEQYQAFYLHVIKGLSPREVAKVLDISTGQVYLIKHRLAKPFRKTVEELKSKLI
jgi:RNA polymerase sigma-70 factor (ECF subfamily)